MYPDKFVFKEGLQKAVAMGGTMEKLKLCVSVGSEDCNPAILVPAGKSESFEAKKGSASF